MENSKNYKLFILLTNNLIAAQEIERESGIIKLIFPAFVQKRKDFDGYHFELVPFTERGLTLYETSLLGEVTLPEEMLVPYEHFVQEVSSSLKRRS